VRTVRTGRLSEPVSSYTSFNLSGASRSYLGAQASRLPLVRYIPHSGSDTVNKRRELPNRFQQFIVSSLIFTVPTIRAAALIADRDVCIPRY
jgi:hypothetical protein